MARIFSQNNYLYFKKVKIGCALEIKISKTYFVLLSTCTNFVPCTYEF